MPNKIPFVGNDEMDLEYDFSTKVAGTVVECPLKLYRATNGVDIANLPLPTDVSVWSEIQDQNTLDKMKSANQLPITNISTTNKTAQWFNGEVMKNLVLQTSTQVACRDDLLGNSPNIIEYSTGDGKVHFEVEGNTLKNELTYNSTTWAEWTRNSGVVGDTTGLEFTVTNGTNSIATINSNLKVSTKYGFLYNVISSTLSANQPFGIGNALEPFAIFVPPTTIGNQKSISTTKSSFTDNKIRLYTGSTEATGAKIKLKDIRVYELPTGSEIESDFTNMSADALAVKYPFASGIKSVGEDVGGAGVHKIEVLSRGKNLLKGVEVGSINSDGSKQIDATRTRTIEKMVVKPNTSYSISGWFPTNTIIYVLRYNNLGVLISRDIIAPFVGTKYTTDSVTYFLDIVAVSWTSFSNPQIEEGSTATPYTPYVEDKINIPLTQPLRKLPNGAFDKYSEGSVTRTIARVVFNGGVGENWGIASTNTNTIRFYLVYNDIKQGDLNTVNRLICNKFSVTSSNASGIDVDNEFIAISTTGASFILQILKSKLSTQDVAGFKTWLASNPTTVLYEPVTPTTEAIAVPQISGFVNGSLLVDSGSIPNKTNILSYLLPATSGLWQSADKTNVTTLNGTNLSVTSNILGNTPQIKVKFNVVDMLKQKYGSLPCPNNIASEVAWVKANIGSIKIDDYIFGLGASGYKAYLSAFRVDVPTWGSWILTSNISSSASILTGSLNVLSIISNSIDLNGFVQFLSYTNPTNQNASGVFTPSTINMDYINLDVQLKPPSGYDLLVPSNPRRDDGLGNIVMVEQISPFKTFDYFTNNSVQIAVNTINRASAYLCEIDMSAICSALVSGSNSALKALLKALQIDMWATGMGSNGGVLTSGAIGRIYNSNSLLWATTSLNNETNAITKKTELISTNMGYFINSLNKIYILVTAQYLSDGTIASILNLDYISTKVKLTRVPDVLSLGNSRFIPMTNDDNFSLILKGFSPNWDNTSNTKVLFSLKKGNDDFRLVFDNATKRFILQKYINSILVDEINTGAITFNRWQISDFILQISASRMQLHHLINNKNVIHSSKDVANSLVGTWEMYLMHLSNGTLQADAFLERCYYYNNTFTTSEVESMLKGYAGADDKLKALSNQFKNPALITGFIFPNNKYLIQGQARLFINNNITRTVNDCEFTTTYNENRIEIIGSAVCRRID